MKITKRQLKRIIKEEKAKVLAEQKIRKVVRASLIAKNNGYLNEGFLDKLKGLFGKGKKKGMSEEEAKKLASSMADLRPEIEGEIKRIRTEREALDNSNTTGVVKILRLYNQRDVLDQLADKLLEMLQGEMGKDNQELVDELDDLKDGVDMILSYVTGRNDERTQDILGWLEAAIESGGSEGEVAKNAMEMAKRPVDFDALGDYF